MPPKNMTLEEFAEKLLEDKGFKDLDNEVREEMLQDLVGRLNNQINASLIEALPPEKAEELNKMTDDENTKESEIQKFFAENVTDFTGVFVSALIGFRKTYLGL